MGYVEFLGQTTSGNSLQGCITSTDDGNIFFTNCDHNIINIYGVNTTRLENRFKDVGSSSSFDADIVFDEPVRSSVNVEFPVFMSFPFQENICRSGQLSSKIKVLKNNSPIYVQTEELAQWPPYFRNVRFGLLDFKKEFGSAASTDYRVVQGYTDVRPAKSWSITTTGANIVATDTTSTVTINKASGNITFNVSGIDYFKNSAIYLMQSGTTEYTASGNSSLETSGAFKSVVRSTGFYYFGNAPLMMYDIRYTMYAGISVPLVKIDYTLTISEQTDLKVSGDVSTNEFRVLTPMQDGYRYNYTGVNVGWRAAQPVKFFAFSGATATPASAGSTPTGVPVSTIMTSTPQINGMGRYFDGGTTYYVNTANTTRPNSCFKAYTTASGAIAATSGTEIDITAFFAPDSNSHATLHVIPQFEINSYGLRYEPPVAPTDVDIGFSTGILTTNVTAGNRKTPFFIVQDHQTGVRVVDQSGTILSKNMWNVSSGGFYDFRWNGWLGAGNTAISIADASYQAPKQITVLNSGQAGSNQVRIGLWAESGNQSPYLITNEMDLFFKFQTYLVLGTGTAAVREVNDRVVFLQYYWADSIRRSSQMSESSFYGVSKTHTIWMWPNVGTGVSDAINNLVQDPPYMTVDPEYFVQTECVPGISAASQSQGWATGLENALERAMASHYEVDYVLGVNNLYPSFWDWNDVPWSLNGGFRTFDNGGIQGTFPLLLQYLRTGKRKYFKRAVPTILKHRDVNISWLGPASVTGTQWGNMFTQATYFIPEKFSQASYGMSPVITRGVRWVSTSYEELYLYYLLTGDKRCREIIEGLCQKYQNWGSSSLVGNDIIYASSGWWPKTVSRPTQTPLVYGIDRDDRHYMRNLQAVWEITANNSCREELDRWLGYEVTSSQQAGVARNENYSPILMNNDGRKVTWENIHRYNKLAVPSTTKTNYINFITNEISDIANPTGTFPTTYGLWTDDGIWNTAAEVSGIIRDSEGPNRDYRIKRLLHTCAAWLTARDTNTRVLATLYNSLNNFKKWTSPTGTPMTTYSGIWTEYQIPGGGRESFPESCLAIIYGLNHLKNVDVGNLTLPDNNFPGFYSYYDSRPISISGQTYYYKNRVYYNRTTSAQSKVKFLSNLSDYGLVQVIGPSGTHSLSIPNPLRVGSVDNLQRVQDYVLTFAANSPTGVYTINWLSQTDHGYLYAIASEGQFVFDINSITTGNTNHLNKINLYPISDLSNSDYWIKTTEQSTGITINTAAGGYHKRYQLTDSNDNILIEEYLTKDNWDFGSVKSTANTSVNTLYKYTHAKEPGSQKLVSFSGIKPYASRKAAEWFKPNLPDDVIASYSPIGWFESSSGYLCQDTGGTILYPNFGYWNYSGGFDTGVIRRWTDKSGRGRHLFNTGVVNTLPIYAYANIRQEQMTVAKFQRDSGSYLESNLWPTGEGNPTLNNILAFAVVQVLNTGFNTLFASNNTNIANIQKGTDVYRVNHLGTYDSASGLDLNNYSMNLVTFQSVESGSTITAELQINGIKVQKDVTSSSVGQPTFGQFRLGYDGSSNYLDGNVAEMIWYTGYFNQQQVRDISIALARKYHLELAYYSSAQQSDEIITSYNPIGWWSADGTVYSDSGITLASTGNKAFWVMDKSGRTTSGNPMRATGINTAPVYTIRTIKGVPYKTLAFSDQFLTTPVSNVSAPANGVSFFVIYETTGTERQSTIIGSSASTTLRLGQNKTANWSRLQLVQSAQQETVTGLQSHNVLYLAFVHYNNLAGTTGLIWWNYQNILNTGGFTNLGVSEWNMATYGGAAASVRFRGNIYETAMFTGVLSEDMRRKISNGLIRKYNIDTSGQFPGTVSVPAPTGDAAIASYNPLMWYSSHTGVFSDTGGTTPISAYNQTVRHWKNRVSNNYHLMNMGDGAVTGAPSYIQDASYYGRSTGCLFFNHNVPYPGPLNFNDWNWLKTTGNPSLNTSTIFVIAQRVYNPVFEADSIWGVSLIPRSFISNGNTGNIEIGDSGSWHAGAYPRVQFGSEFLGHTPWGILLNKNIYRIKLKNNSLSDMWINGNIQPQGNGSGEPFTKVMIGAGNTGLSPRPWHGTITEVVIFNRELGDAEITDIEYTLKQKWGLP